MKLIVFMYAEISPYATHFLCVSSLHTLYVEESGNPNGIPVLFVHGGPGGGTEAKHRQYFNPEIYRIILFDQRGCGQSKPFGEIRENTTQDLVADMEKIREFLHIDSWVLFGGSWGSTLSLVYAISHPERVQKMVLRGIFLGTQDEIDWFVYPKGTELFYPESFERMQKYAGGKEGEDLMQFYAHSLKSKNALEGAKEWGRYEVSLCALNWREINFDERVTENSIAVTALEIHYFQNNCFLEDNFILKNIEKIAHIPTTIIQGRYDIVCPPMYAYRLHKALPHSKLIMLLAGHSGSDFEVKEALVEAMNDGV